MWKRSLYRALLALLPPRRLNLQSLPGSKGKVDIKGLGGILRRHRAIGGALAFFDAEGIQEHLVYGLARPDQPVAGDTAFRLASLSKTVTAMCLLRLAQDGSIDLSADVDAFLPYSLRHPQARDRAITLGQLLSHSAGIQDAGAYHRHLGTGLPAPDLLQGDTFTSHLPGEGCTYSNFAFGLAACVAEGMTGQGFEALMQGVLFQALGMQASFYPQKIGDRLANSWRVLPPRRRPNFDAARRSSLPLEDWQSPAPLTRYALAQGSCCTDVQSLAKLGVALLCPGYLSQESLNNMRHPHADLSQRDPSLRQGLGLFIHEDPAICPHTLYGHQGMAYGAVNLLFIDPRRQRGLISLNSGASETREHILTDFNKALLRFWLAHA